MVNRHLRTAVFLDRDGTLIRDVNYLSKIEEIEILPGAIDALKSFKKAGFLVFMVTNQGGIAKNKLSFYEYYKVTKAIENTLKGCSAALDGIVFCPHHPNGVIPELKIHCRCRKPAPGMLFQLAQQHRVCLPLSWMIGDRISDVQAGLKAGCSTLLVRTGYGKSEEKEAAKTIKESRFFGVIDGIQQAAKIICP